MRASAVGAVLALLLLTPLATCLALGFGPGEAVRAVAAGFVAAHHSVGWVLAPQLILAIGVLALLLERLAQRAAGVPERDTPRWLEPAVESALLLGMLGTISGMVRGFAGISPEDMEPGPLLHALGTALRSSFLGFGIALVGVWIRDTDAVPAAVGAALPAEARP